MMALRADRGELGRFIGALFQHADDGTYASLRAFDQFDSKRPAALLRPVKIGRDLEGLIEAATVAAEEMANRERPIVFAPPICTFSNADRARLEDLANGLTLSVEIDEGDTLAARRRLETLLGPATIVVESGGEWSDPLTGEVFPKIHLHWRLSEPTREESDHAKLRQARDLAARLVGADPTGKPVVHPLRWPGSWNRKAAPRMARTVAFNDATEINLNEALDAVLEAVEAAGLAHVETPQSGTPEASAPMVAAAMAAIPNVGTEVHYDTWIRLGYAVHRATGGTGYGIWRDWSAKSDKFNEEETAQAWRRIGRAILGSQAPRTIGAGTIFFEAKAAGWERPRAYDEPPPPNSPDDYGETVVIGAVDGAEPAVTRIASKDQTPRIVIEMFNDISPALHTNDMIEDVLGTGAMSVVYGESNSGKTFFVLDAALHKACGWAWRGKHLDKGGVIYCCFEGSHGIRNRVTAFKMEHNLDGQEIPFGIVTVPLDLCQSEEDTDALIAAIRAKADELGFTVEWVIMDTLARAMAGGNENAPDDMGALVKNGDRIRDAIKCHLTWIHHSGKDQARGARGHSSLRAATDTEIEISNTEGARVARVTKQREYQCDGSFGFSLKVVELGQNHRGKAVASCVVVAEDAENAENTPATNRHKLTKNAELSMRSLHLALDREGTYLPALPEYPAATFAVSAATWRAEFYQLKGDGVEKKRTYFSRAETELVAKNVITQRNGYVWLVKQGRNT